MHSAAITVFRVRLLLLAMVLALIGMAAEDGNDRLAVVNPAPASQVTPVTAKPQVSDVDASSTVRAPNLRHRAKGRQRST
jgi:hypothetical protein